MLSSVNLPKVEAAQPTSSTSSDSISVASDEELSEVIVAGTLSPLTALQSARIVGVINRQQIESAAVQTVNDLLKLAVGVDVRQRGGFGIQTDISIDGGTFDQITLLLNGVNITSPHTGHLSADFPISLSDIERIEILEGAASRVYGASAFGGAINVVTKKTDSPPALPIDSPPNLPDKEGTDSPPALPVREGANTNDRRFSVEGGVMGGMYGTVGADAHISFWKKISDSKVSAPSLTGRAGGESAPSLSGRAGGESVPSLSGRLGGEFVRSDGATQNSDFQRGNVFFRSELDANDFRVEAQAGFSFKSYGANTFYSAAYPNQYERNRHTIISLAAETKGRIHLRPEVYWHRLIDNFELIRGTTTGENFHRTDVHGARVTADLRWIAGRTAFGAEVREEGIYSTSLGQPITSTAHHIAGEGDLFYTRHDARTNLSLNAEHTLLLPHFTASVGVLANMNTRFDDHLRFYPGIDLAYTLSSTWRLFASYNQGFRLPTFTDLYYKSPTHEGNQGMRAEESHSFQIGVKGSFNSSSYQCLRSNIGHSILGEFSTKFFYHRGTDLIDWVMYSPDDVFHSANFDLDNMGFQATATLQLSQLFNNPAAVLQRLQAGYTYLYQNRRDDTYIYKSNYAMEYLRHKLVCSLDLRIVSHLSASWTLRWQNRMGSYILYENAQSTGQLVPYDPYATLDLRLRWTARHYELWADATNLLNHRYYDLGNIPQPGIVVLAGVRVRL